VQPNTKPPVSELVPGIHVNGVVWGSSSEKKNDALAVDVVADRTGNESRCSPDKSGCRGPTQKPREIV